MSTVAELNQRIAVANAESKKINNERNINLGKKQTLETQLKQALEKYEKDFGVKLTLETLQAETEKVMQAKEAELVKVEQMLVAIQNGEYKQADEVAKTETVVVKEADGTVSSTFEVEVKKAENQPKPVEVATSPNKPISAENGQVSTPTKNTAKIEPQSVTEPSMSVAPPPTMKAEEVAPPTPPTPPTPNKLNLTGIDALADFVAPPTTVAKPVEEKKEEVEKPTGAVPDLTSFAAILGGTQFSV